MYRTVSDLKVLEVLWKVKRAEVKQLQEKVFSVLSSSKTKNSNNGEIITGWNSWESFTEKWGLNMCLVGWTGNAFPEEERRVNVRPRKTQYAQNFGEENRNKSWKSQRWCRKAGKSRTISVWIC